jgi:hypothetical protein
MPITRDIVATYNIAQSTINLMEITFVYFCSTRFAIPGNDVFEANICLLLLIFIGACYDLIWNFIIKPKIKYKKSRRGSGLRRPKTPVNKLMESGRPISTISWSSISNYLTYKGEKQI